MKVPIKLHRPFGPFILESTCPQIIVDSLNQFTEESAKNPEMSDKYCYSSGNIPNLLLRDFEVVYLTEDFCEDIGLKEYVEMLGNYYLNRIDTQNYPYREVKLSIINEFGDDQKDFEYSDKMIYADAWVNRYYSGDYTPLHDHGSDLAGIIVLKYPEKELSEENTKNIQSEGKQYRGAGRNGGRVQFIHGMNNTFASDEYSPEQFECQTLLFPAWLSHLVYPMKTNAERKTLSFNLISDRSYYERKEGF